jgi:hypothetical protein
MSQLRASLRDYGIESSSEELTPNSKKGNQLLIQDVRLADVRPQKIEWLWRDRIPHDRRGREAGQRGPEGSPGAGNL